MRSETEGSAGPLAGLRIIEFAGLGPGPFCAMMLADHGAEVIRIDRFKSGEGIGGDPQQDLLNRSRKNLNVELKSAEGISFARRLCGSADAVIEGFRPGTMERLGLGPDVLCGDNARLVYGRMTGWGQTGPIASAAGHDINYISLSGALHAMGPAEAPPVPPLNLVGDYGGGGMMLAFGVLAAILNARETGQGQVIDCAMTDGSALLMTLMYSLRATGRWSDARGANFLDGAAPYYRTYRTRDGGYVAVGAIEPHFNRLFLETLGLSADPLFASQSDPRLWSAQAARLESIFADRSRAEWCAVFEGIDACVAPVLSMAEAPGHPHNAARETFIEVDGVIQPAPAPRYSRTPSPRPTAMTTGTDATDLLLTDLGFTAEDLRGLRAAGAVA